MTKNRYLESAKDALFHGIGTPVGGTFSPDPFQLAAVRSVTNSNDTLVVAPTGSGKTYIAVESIAACLELGLRAVYTTPLKALSNTKYADLKRRFEPKYKVGILTGDRKIDSDADVVVSTTEIYRNELYRGNERYSVVVLDEVHYIADSQRGPVWEESIILTPKSTTLLMLSASIPNYQEMAAWLEEVRGKECTVIVEKDRPVELRYGFMHPQLGVIPLRDSRGAVARDVVQYYSGFGLDRSGNRVVTTKGFRRSPKRRRR